MPKETQQLFDSKAFLATLTSRPGVYRMLDEEGTVIYVGKARNLKKRVTSYFRASGLASRTMAMVSKIRSIEVAVTGSETEALLLEQNLIKTLRPAYNIQLRDDKSYPYILLTDKDKYPRLSFYRGSRKRKGRFFGPYPSAHATRETLQVLQKVFSVRQCQDSYFRNRSRPCLQYQIERCTGPCVNLISPEDYRQDVHYSTLFLQGKSDALTRDLTNNMEEAATRQEYERAAQIRNQIIDLRRIQQQQFVTNQGSDADVLAASIQATYHCVHAVYIRGGRIIGSKSFFPRFKLATDESALLSAFVAQSYLSEDKAANIPAEIIVSQSIEGKDELEAALAYVAQRKIKLATRVRGHRAKWLEMAGTNASEALQGFISNKQNIHQRFQQLQDMLKLDAIPNRIECFDISHTSGEGTVASCVVFDAGGAVKSDYRRFNIEDITPGDDYAAMSQALNLRFTRLARGEAKIPDVLLIDGGKGQLSQAREVLEEFQLPEIQLLGIAKGISRRAGQETLFLLKSGRFKEISLVTESPALHLLQQVRDEAHRFAITGHRQRRSKKRKQSTLEQIPGLGPKRRKELLRYFGGRQEIVKASEAEIAKVTGISKKLAENIYAYLHNA
ncbi:MAG: excinuclease ABC subunit UvrC [Gammaproteobacteria bacterium]|jgi:excinuclease ABC subunit C|nr:excinuclease ABC subunit C [Gammaproteobacteria bacterium]MDP6098208.1 excinuclease ABC subunit UvrC [Gammaproteobacteria bacterium]HJO11702.1 excinuclease ABC subunit UvrC [Gammaproteobacteria bacterium]|tara:strand:+ start:262 stop:2109 length:1848 start_codon:yes stop_codon:yes gene_type:complete